MEILKFDNAPQSPRKSKKKGSSNLKVMTALASVAAVAVLGSTLAANITLNNNASLEFGQGVQLTAACDGDGITVSPGALFVNASGAGSFMFKTIGLSGIDLRATNYCQGTTFTLGAYDSTTATPLTIATYGASTAVTQATFQITATANAGVSNGVTTSGLSGWNTASGAITLSLTTPASTSGAVYKLTLQTS